MDSTSSPQVEQKLNWALCHTCKLRHPIVFVGTEQLVEGFGHFASSHKGHELGLLPQWDAYRSDGALDVVPVHRLAEPGGYFHWLEYIANADVKEAFGTASQGITITLASLASSATVGREATAIDNITNLFGDVLVYLSVALQTGTPANDKAVYVYSAASEDGTNYTDNATGLDAALTLRSPTNLRLVGVINTPDAGALTYKGGPFNIAPAWGGVLPPKWSIIVVQFTGTTFSATEANHTKEYRGVYNTVI